MSAGASDVLQRILAETRSEVERRKREVPLPAPGRPRADRPSGRFRSALERPGIGVIAEFKRRSPSAGALREGADLAATVRAYSDGGAVALSVLTEGPNFAGALEDLVQAGAACELPLLRKDFILDAYQLSEASAAGADAVLLIVAALTAAELSALHAAAAEQHLDVLVEVHDRAELDLALEAGAQIIGVNNRDLRDFSVDVGRTEALIDQVPPGIPVISESGISTPAQLARLEHLGVAAVLVGETLMRAGDAAAALAELTSFRHGGRDI